MSSAGVLKSADNVSWQSWALDTAPSEPLACYTSNRDKHPYLIFVKRLKAVIFVEIKVSLFELVLVSLT